MRQDREQDALRHVFAVGADQPGTAAGKPIISGETANVLGSRSFSCPSPYQTSERSVIDDMALPDPAQRHRQPQRAVFEVRLVGVRDDTGVEQRRRLEEYSAVTNAPNNSARCSSRSRDRHQRCNALEVAAQRRLECPVPAAEPLLRRRHFRLERPRIKLLEQRQDPVKPTIAAPAVRGGGRLNGRSTVRCGSGFSVSGSLRASGSLSIGAPHSLF